MTAAAWQRTRGGCAAAGSPRTEVPLAMVLEWVAWALNPVELPYAVSTVERTLSTLSRLHAGHGVPTELNPCRTAEVREVLRAAKVIRAQDGGQNQAKEIRQGEVALMADLTDASSPPQGIRDRAILWGLYGWGIRVGELVGLDITDVEFRPVDRPDQRGAWVLCATATVRRGKTDQTGEGRSVAAAGVAASALRAWVAQLAEWGIEAGPLFRGFYPGGRLRPGRITTRAVRNLVGDYARRAGLGHRSPHGARAGFATDAAERGVPAKDAMAGRWSSPSSFSRYTRSADAGRNPAAFLTVPTPER